MISQPIKILKSSPFGKALRKVKLPDSPGVYFFLGPQLSRKTRQSGKPESLKGGRKILYIGRATSLRNRIGSYFRGDLSEMRGEWVSRMLPRIRSIEVKKTDSVLEAILLEAGLIKKFQPPYNTDEKDDKSFNCVVITKEGFPQVLLVRKKDIDFSSLTVNSQKSKGHRLKPLAVYGPFPHGFELQTGMKIIRKIFPFRDSKCKPLQGKPCFNRQIGLCPGVCTGEISKKDYAKIIRNLRLFFLGKKPRLLRLLQKEMRGAAKRQEFEMAGELKRQLFALRHIQDVALLKTTNYSLPTTHYRIEAYDLSHFGGKEIVGAMAVVENGSARPSEYRLFKIRSTPGIHETLGLKELLRRRFNHPEWSFPELVVVDGNEVQKKAAEETLRLRGQSIPVVALVKDEKHRPRELLGSARLNAKHREGILLANSEAHRFALKFQRKRDSEHQFFGTLRI